MAERRMFAKTIIDSDAFLDMPLSTQALYFHLCMRADDEGFVNNPKKIMRMIGASEDDAKVLIGKKFIIPFDSGVIVIKHWRIHNYIRADRLKSTNYEEERAMLDVKDNGSYTLCQSSDSQMSVTCPSNVSIGKDRLGKDSIDKNNKREIYKEKKSTPIRNQIPPTVGMVRAYCLERGNSVDAEKFCDFYASKNWYIGKNKMKDWQAAVRTWEKQGGKSDAVTKTMRDLSEMPMTQSEYDEMERLF